MQHIQRALITGATAGIGEAYLKQLAQHCDHVLIVARREDRLLALAEQYGAHCEVQVIRSDLATLEGQARVVEAIRQSEPLDLLVNNAGFSTLGQFVSSDLDKEIEMLRLHQEATLALCRAALPAMCERGQGMIVNVASIGGFAPMPGVAVYGASKAFLVSFSRSLAAEVGPRGVRIQCLCPGYTRTEIHSRDTFKGFDTARVPDELWMDADSVVTESLDALGSDRWLVVTGEHNQDLVGAAIDDLQTAQRRSE